MKKSKIISLFAALFICASLTSCNNEYKNQESYKIYQKAVEEGEFTGTYQEWLDSIKGEKGDTGEDGRSVTSITLTSSEGNIDTYTITYSDGTTSIFKVTNGQDGKQGIQGEKGEDGHTPSITIGGNGNWFIDGVDSGINATGPKGDKGDTGEPGKDGRSILSIELTDQSGNVDTYTITYSDGTTSTFIVTNGEDGLTTRNAVYAGGDAVTGAATVILAMGAGKQAAAERIAYEIEKVFKAKKVKTATPLLLVLDQMELGL